MLENLRKGRNDAMGFVLALAAAVAVGGCVVESGPGGCDCAGTGGAATGGGSGAGGGSAGQGTVVKATVDTDQTLEAAPGEGIGVFIEYAAGGTWHVYATCDTKISNMSCAHDVSVTVPAGVGFGGIRHDGLEGADAVREYSDGLELVTDTSSDFDGVYFETDPGATVRFETWMDGAPEARYVYWIGGGAVHAGAPSNPLDLVPSKP
jgi:hypothetical protein